jgi:hypothetical protein
MANNQLVLICNVLFWATRVRGCFRRWAQPLLRGPEWLFNVRVQPGFYAGPERKILDRYKMRMFIPFALDIPIAMALFIPGHHQLMSFLMLAQVALIHVNHVFSIDIAERQARRFAIPEAEQPVAAIASSMQPRRLCDYTNPKVEWTLALSMMVALAWLGRYYLAAPEHHDVRLVFGVPAFYLYMQVGFLFVKGVVVAWRTPVPQTQAAEHMRVREETRKYYLRMCDWNRVAAAAPILFWPIVLSASPAGSKHLYNIWAAAWPVIGVVAGVWIEFKRKQLATMGLRAVPVKLPDFLHQSEIAKWPVCFQPSTPMLVLKGARGYSLNLANTRSHLGAAYVAGLLVLFVLLPIGH